MPPARCNSCSFDPKNGQRQHSYRLSWQLSPRGADFTWLVRPERSPMHLLPFRAPASALADVKALVDWRLTAPI